MVTELFNAVFQVDHVEGKVLFQPILFPSKRGGKASATADSKVVMNIQLVMADH